MRIISLLILLIICKTHADDQSGKHLFILSGQSNMQRLDPSISFIPTLNQQFGDDNTIVVKLAQNGQSISRWYKAWPRDKYPTPTTPGDLYEKLMEKVNEAIQGQKISSVNFLWMQGEKDAKNKHSSIYEESLKGLIEQISKDLQRDEINFVIGRLSDYGTIKRKSDHWIKIRDIQSNLAESSEYGAWVDTDNYNDGTSSRGTKLENDLHYSPEGYKAFGEKLAKEAIQLIKRHQS